MSADIGKQTTSGVVVKEFTPNQEQYIMDLKYPNSVIIPAGDTWETLAYNPNYAHMVLGGT